MKHKEKLDDIPNLSDTENSIVRNLSFVSVPHIAAKDVLKMSTNFKEWYPKNFRVLIQEEFKNFQEIYGKTNPHHLWKN